MNIEELYRKLSLGVLRNLSMSNEGSGDIIESSRATVIQAANAALTKLYSQFVLREKDVIIQMVPHITNYHLKKRFAVMTRPIVEKYPYILDLPLEPFEEDVIKVLAVYTSHGDRLPLNDAESPWSVFTPQPEVLQVPKPVLGAALSCTYQAYHTELDWQKLDQPVDVPWLLEDAFLSYIAFKLFTDMGTQEQLAKAMAHFENYRMICEDVVDRELISVSVSSLGDKFIKRGFP